MKLDIKQLLIKFLQTPMIVESGTDGIWTYRKWSDGTAECWAKTAATTYSFTAQAGYAYYTTEQQNLPSGLFTSVIAGFTNRLQGTGSAPSNSLMTININNLTTAVINYYVQSTYSGSQSLAISLYVIGKWK